MNFIKYQHLERLGTSEVEGILDGTCYIFSKVDGTNASVWLDDEGNLCAGSRKRKLSLDADNAGFYDSILDNENIANYLEKNPTHRLYGEWLVPHSLKTYNDNAWRKFYVFDVSMDKSEDEIAHDGDSRVKYLPYDQWADQLRECGISVIPPLAILENPSYDDLSKLLEQNTFLIKEDSGFGEGIVIKNYDFKNKYGRQTWAKLIASEFKQKHKEVMGGGDAKPLVEQLIANEYVTEALVEKVIAKIKNDNDGDFNGKNIPQLLQTVYYDVVREDCWNFVKKHKNPTINFKTLQHFVFASVKERVPYLF